MRMRTDPRFNGSSPVRCASCAAIVLVAKFSAQQTSIQWSLPAMRACSGYTAGAGCPRLRASIDEAVLLGVVPVGPP
jgi:hypothetical protein